MKGIFLADESGSYGASDIQVLEGLEAVRKRPGMYIGSTGVAGLHHLVWEVVDNAVDEAMAGFCSLIEVELLADGAVRVSDDGRGIPVGPHPKYPDKSAAEVVLTVLHAGGKFGGNGYKVSGGLHGVGVSVVNALATKLILEIDRDGKHHRQEYGDGGVAKGSLDVVGDSPGGRTGTTVTFWPDPTVFETTDFSTRTMLERFRMMAYLNAGLEFHVVDRRPGHELDESFRFDGGIVDFVRSINETKESLFAEIGYYEAEEDDAQVQIAFQWNTGYHEGLHSFANGIATGEGGMHEEGFSKAITNVVNRYARERGLL